MAEFTKEQLVGWANSLIEETHTDVSISRTDAHAESYRAQLALLEIALAALTDGMEQEPVGEVILGDYDDCGDYPDAKVVCTAAQGQAGWNNFRNGTKLYAAPQLPQPAVPQRVPESLKLRLITIGDVVEDTNEYCQDIWNACRAAMLGAEPVSHGDELPMDYQQGHKDGLEWAARLAEANHPQTGDWLYDDPLELAKAIRKGPDIPVEPMQKLTFREALAAIRNLGPIDAEKIQAERDALNEPDVPDGYALVPVEMTPEQMRAVQLNSELGAYAASNLTGAYSLFREFWDVAIAAAPQQELKSALEMGMARYGDAMQKLADGGD